MANTWQFKAGDKVYGAFTDAQLEQLIRSGRVDPDTPVRPSENSVWRKAGNTAGLFGNAEPAAAAMQADVEAIVDDVIFGRRKAEPAGEWQIQDGERVIGPLSAERLERMIAAGKVNRKTVIRQVGKTSFRAAERFDGLFATDDADERPTRLCPFCAEPIQVAAVKCKHCGEFLDGRPKPQTAPTPAPTVEQKPKRPVPQPVYYSPTGSTGGDMLYGLIWGVVLFILFFVLALINGG